MRISDEQLALIAKSKLGDNGALARDLIDARNEIDSWKECFYKEGQIKLERDKYKAALEQIRDNRWCDCCLCVDLTAAEALKANKHHPIIPKVVRLISTKDDLDKALVRAGELMSARAGTPEYEELVILCLVMDHYDSATDHIIEWKLKDV